jgi:ATP-binding cassette subfamily F protein uup
VEIGTKLEVAYFDQMRHQLDLEKTVIDNLAEGRDFIEIDGQSRHVLSYLGDFLFSPQRARTPVKALSGGERARLLLAKLFSKPANLLVLDEPTNDLDVETLELLEEVLSNYKGTVLMVSHDRAFLDNVVTSTLVFEGEGQGARVRGRLRGLDSPGRLAEAAGRDREQGRQVRAQQRSGGEGRGQACARCGGGGSARRRSSATSCSVSWRCCRGRSTRWSSAWPRRRKK